MMCKIKLFVVSYNICGIITGGQRQGVRMLVGYRIKMRDYGIFHVTITDWIELFCSMVIQSVFCFSKVKEITTCILNMVHHF